MGESLLAGKSERLVSLDVFRGITIASMILVNNPGTWSAMYRPLGHAQWDGWTPTDFVFPFFLFIVGVAMVLSFDKRMARGESRMVLLGHVVRRSLLLLLLAYLLGQIPAAIRTVMAIEPSTFFQTGWKALLGMRMMPSLSLIAGLGFLFADDMDAAETPRAQRNKLIAAILLGGGLIWLVALEMIPGYYYFSRIPGVLPRIGLAYFLASIILFRTGWKGRLLWALALINVYYLIMRYIGPPAGYEIAAATGLVRDAPADALFSGALNDWIDVKLFGDHLYRHRPDPEGLLSTIPAVATVLFGALVGQWLKTPRDRHDKALWLFVAGNVFFILGLCMDPYFPINKKIWSSSYVIFAAGWAMMLLSLCYYLVDIKGYKKWSFPFVVYGTNAIFIFWLSGLVAILMGMITFAHPDKVNETISLRSYLWNHIYSPSFDNIKDASLAYALSYVTLWFLLTLPLYYKRIFIKI